MKTDLWNRSKPAQLIQIYSTLIALGLAAYFLFMYAIGLVPVTGLRYFNIVIMVAGIYFALKQFRRTHDHMSYFRVLTLGTAIGTIATTAFAVFIFAFFTIEKNAMLMIQQKEPLGSYLNPYIASIIIILEGNISAFGVAYLCGNFMRTDSATVPQGGEIETTSWGDHG
jgi:hypothetical protein